MLIWTRMCCAIDATQPSRAALEHAARLARVSGATLHVLHVRRVVDMGWTAFAPPPSPRRGDVEGARRISEWIAEARLVVPDLVVAVERIGDPVTEIAAYAEEWGCDVIVLGTHARHGVGRLVLGSVAEAVMRRVRCPVLVVPRREEGAEDREGPDRSADNDQLTGMP